MPRRTHRSRSRTLVNIGALVALLAGVAYGVSLIRMPDFDFSDGRRHLDQIPIDRAESCGEVEAIHAQLDAFAQTYGTASWGFYLGAGTTIGPGEQASTTTAVAAPAPAPVPAPSWPELEAEVEVAAAQLDAALAHGIPHFPKRIRSELAAVRASIAEGQARLPVESVQRFNALTQRVFERGQLHAGYASDLVGHQCRVPLGA